MTAALSISGTPSSRYGLTLSSAPSWLDSPARTFQSVAIPGRIGVTPLSASQEGYKTLTLQGTIIGDSASDARSKLDAFKVALITGSVTVTLSDRPGVFIYCDFQSLVVTGFESGSLIAWMLPVEIALQCADPLWYDTDFSSASIASGSTGEIALGSGPVRPLLTLMGPSTDPVISLKDYLGTLYQEMIFNGLALDTGDALVIDCDAMTIKKNGINALIALTAGDFFQVEASEVAFYDTSSWPTIGLTGGGTLSVAYRRTWR